MKRSTWKKRALASALALTMAASVLPMAGFAAGTSGTGTPLADTGDLVMNKTAKLENDGTYTIQLEAFSTGEVTTVSTQTPTDIVLVLDVSGSMDENFTYTSGQQWTSVRDDFGTNNGPTDAYHHCPDGSYSPVEWTEWGGWWATGRHRYVCTNCHASRKWDTPTRFEHIPGEGDNDSWNLWRYEDITETKAKLPALKEAVNDFLAGVADENAAISDTNLQHQVAIVKFASETMHPSIGDNKDWYGYNYTQTIAGMTTVTTENLSGLTDKVNDLDAGGATAADKGLQMAQGILNDTAAGRNKVVILFTDGEPTYSSSFQSYVANSAVSTAKELKGDNTTVYTIGVVTNANPADTSGRTNAYLNAVSSNYPNAKSYTDLGDGGDNGYYKTIGTSGSLANIFEEIEEDITTTTIELDANAQLRDFLNDGFVLTPDSQVTVQTDTYTGRDSQGNRVFANNPKTFNATVSKDLENNTVTVSGFDFSAKYLVDGSKPDENDFTAAVQGEKLVVTITRVEATDSAVTNGLISTNTRSSGIYEDSDAIVPFARFPQPVTQLSSKVYVLDYAKPVNLADMPNTTVHMDGNGMHYFTSQKTSLDEEYGTVSNNMYTPTTMNWDGYDQYYVFGQWNNTPVGVTTGNNTWTKVTVMPANNVYYEDDFVTNSQNGTVGIVYTGEWTTDGTSSGNTETPNNGVHGGWVEGDAGLSNDTEYSDGSAHKATGSATATFTFTGTGVDIYSRTNLTTGTVLARLVDNNGNEDSQTQTMIVNNKAESGDYYQIPTLTFAKLPYGNYTVTITVTSATGTYYLDGIRVYNPIQGDPDVDAAYGNEVGAVFQSVRNILLDSNSLTGESETAEGIVFLDKDKGTNTSSIGAYKDYGPKNEVYLAQGQSIGFKLNNFTQGTAYIGLKVPAGDSTTVEVTNGAGKSNLTINHSTDLYYEVTPNADGLIVITNTGDSLLSITKLRTTANSEVGEMDLASLMSYMAKMDTLPEVPYEDEMPGGSEDSGNVDIENPDQDQSQETPNQGNSFMDILKDIFESIWNWF